MAVAPIQPPYRFSVVRFGPLPGPQLLLQVLQALYNIHVGSSKTKQHSNKQPPSAGDSEEKQLENGASAEEGGCNVTRKYTSSHPNVTRKYTSSHPERRKAARSLCYGYVRLCQAGIA
jgi:hypothetical protein